MTVVVVLSSHSRLFTLGWMCPLKRKQARREWVSSYDPITHSRLYCRDREKKYVVN